MLRTLIFVFFACQVWSQSLKGTATTLDGKTLLYVEIHKIQNDDKGLNSKIETFYKDPKGETFAQMTSDFSKHKTLPDIQFSDTRFSIKEEMILDEKTQKVEFRLFQKDQLKMKKQIPVEGEMAAGQGFDNFVKLNYEKLQSKTLPLTFGVVSKLDFFSFKAYKKGSAKPGQTEFGIDLLNFVYRLFSSELLLSYEDTTKRLLTYRGLSNLLDKNGKSQTVLIKYEPLLEAP